MYVFIMVAYVNIKLNILQVNSASYIHHHHTHTSNVCTGILKYDIKFIIIIIII